MSVLAAMSVCGLSSMLAPDHQKLKAAPELNWLASGAWERAIKDCEAQAVPPGFDAKLTELALAKRQLDALSAHRPDVPPAHYAAPRPQPSDRARSLKSSYR